MKPSRKILNLIAAVSMTVLALGGCSDHSGSKKNADADKAGQSHAESTISIPVAETPAGNFLSSHYAQSQYDWSTAGTYLNKVLDADPGNPELLKRSMILAAGSGDMGKAAERANMLLKTESHNSLALLILSIDALAENNLPAAEKYLSVLPDGDLTDFIKPLILGWVKAGEKQFDIKGFNDTSIHQYHAACIALFLHGTGKAKDAYLASALNNTHKMLEAGGIGLYDAERGADLLAAIGERDDALTLYRTIMAQTEDKDVKRKIDALKKNDDSIRPLLQPLQIKTAVQGAAMAMYDMAFVLYQENSDTSAKLFAEMALALNPGMTSAQLLLGDTLARNDRYDEAIKLFEGVPKTDPAYPTSQRHAAELMAQAGRHDDAKAALNRLYNDTHDISALIRVGDIDREEDKYADALKIYNQAANAIGGKIPDEYWYLLYARGMAYERTGQWDKAEADLKAALEYRPNNAYMMNYLAYGWTDKGIHLPEALAMLRRAVALQPTDGFITDSLGWTYYRMGQYAEAIPHLERAVELQPYDTTINDHLGDAYWRVDRQIEAKYQWERARNNAGAKNEAEKKSLDKKLQNGLPAAPPADWKASIAPAHAEAQGAPRAD